MKISVTFVDNVLEVRKEGEGLQAESWQKKLDDFELKKNISTGITIKDKKQRKILFWRPIEENILMVYTRGKGQLCSEQRCLSAGAGENVQCAAHFPDQKRAVLTTAGRRGGPGRFHFCGCCPDDRRANLSAL